MLTVTQTAGAHLTELLSKSPQDAIVRLVRSKGRLKIRKDYERVGDVTFAHEGKVVLSLHRSLSEELAKRTLDLRTSAESRPKLRLKTV